MLELLKVTNFPTGTQIKDSIPKSAFRLDTCQRTLILEDKNSTNNIEYLTGSTYYGDNAYHFLLEIICGMQSRLIGESEIVSQFKQAYQSYIQQEERNTTLLLILEKLFKDAKEIRTKYLLGLTQNTYSSIARKFILNKHQAQKVLILGSGQMAEDLINQFKKKTQVYISARNEQKVAKLVEQHRIQTLPWKDFTLYSEFAHIVNSIGCSKGTFIHHDFFDPWKLNNPKGLFIDLGSPSVIDTPLETHDGVMRLSCIFEAGAIHEEHKLKQIDTARDALKEIVNKRKSCLNQKSKKNEIYARKI